MKPQIRSYTSLLKRASTVCHILVFLSRHNSFWNVCPRGTIFVVRPHHGDMASLHVLYIQAGQFREILHQTHPCVFGLNTNARAGYLPKSSNQGYPNLFRLDVEMRRGTLIMIWFMHRSLFPAFSLEESVISFADLFHLVAFYCISR